MEPTPCPRCGTMTDTLMKIEPGMRLGLAEACVSAPPEYVCRTCYDELVNSVSQGLKLRLERDNRDKNKMLMWKSRVSLIKTARQYMQAKAYSDAAVTYEKYIRVLEIVYNLKKGELTPAVFNNSKRSKELTVIASVYWDLLRIYDTSPRYGDRMQRSAEKLADFLPFSTVYPDIVKKAQMFARSANHPEIVRQVLKNAAPSRGPCFIADAAFASQPHAAEPMLFRRFRDRRLRPSPLGRRVIWTYYRLSPPLARVIRRSPRLSALARATLRAVARRL